MSTTTSPTTYNVDQLAARGIDPSEVQANIDAGTTEKRAVALALRDHGSTNAEGGAAFGDIFGAPVKSGGFGNLVTGALRDVGRGDEVESGTGKGGGVKVTSFKDYVANYRKSMDAKRDALQKALDDANQALKNIDPDAIVAAETERLDKVIAEAQATKKALAKDSSAFVEAQTERLRHAADAARTAHAEGMALIDAELAEAGLTA